VQWWRDWWTDLKPALRPPKPGQTPERLPFTDPGLLDDWCRSARTKERR
jgi:hypothetical protein